MTNQSCVQEILDLFPSHRPRFVTWAEVSTLNPELAKMPRVSRGSKFHLVHFCHQHTCSSKGYVAAVRLWKASWAPVLHSRVPCHKVHAFEVIMHYICTTAQTATAHLGSMEHLISAPSAAWSSTTAASCQTVVEHWSIGLSIQAWGAKHWDPNMQLLGVKHRCLNTSSTHLPAKRTLALACRWVSSAWRCVKWTVGKHASVTSAEEQCILPSKIHSSVHLQWAKSARIGQIPELQQLWLQLRLLMSPSTLALLLMRK